MTYDGTGKIGAELAALYGFSPKNQTRIAELMKLAKVALEITNASRLNTDDKLRVYQWHSKRVQDIKRPDTVKQPEPVQNIKPIIKKAITPKAEPVQDFKQVDAIQFCEVKPVAVQNIKQADTTEAVQDFKQIDDYEVIHFGIKLYPNNPLHKVRRSSVALEGYFIKALVRRHGLTDNTSIRKWIEQRIIDDGGLDITNSKLTTTTQVKRMIVEAIV
jgi:hypothetical protein